MPRPLKKQWLTNELVLCLAHLGCGGNLVSLLLATRLPRVCCWRSTDPDERHWAHLRSWPFLNCNAVWAFGALARRRGIRLIDITAYRSTSARRSCAIASPELLNRESAACGYGLGVPAERDCGHSAAHRRRFGGPRCCCIFQMNAELSVFGAGSDASDQVLQQTRYNCWQGLATRCFHLWQIGPGFEAE